MLVVVDEPHGADLRRRRRRAGVRADREVRPAVPVACRPTTPQTLAVACPAHGTSASASARRSDRPRLGDRPRTRASVEIRDLAYDTRAVDAGVALLLRPGRAASTGTTSRPRRVAARRGRARRRAAARPRRCRSSSCRASARRCRPPRRCSSATRPRELDGRGGHRHERQDDHRVPARTRSSTPPAGGPALLTNIERRVGGESRPTGLNTPEAIDLQRLFREMLDAGDRVVRDGGDVDRRRAGPPRGHALRRARLHEPDAGPPRLPRDDGGLLRSEARALRPGRARGRQRRRRVGATARRRAAGRAHVHAGRRPRRHRAAAARPLQPRERARRDRGGARARRSTRTRSAPGIERVARRAGPLRVGRRGPAVRRDRRLRAHARLARERPARRARARRRPADRRLRRGRRPRPREAAADGPRRRRARRPRDRHHRQPALRGSGGDRRRGRAGGERSRSSSTARDAIEAALARRARRATSS